MVSSSSIHLCIHLCLLNEWMNEYHTQRRVWVASTARVLARIWHIPQSNASFQCLDKMPLSPSPCCTLALLSRSQNSHGLGEESCHLLTALIVSPTHPTFVKLLFWAQISIAASLDAFALDTDRGWIRGTQRSIHHLQYRQNGEKKGERISSNGFSPPKPWTRSDLLPQACSPLVLARRSSQCHWLGRWACTCPEETRLSTSAPTPQQGWAGWCCGCSHWRLHTALHGSSCQRLGKEKARAGS